MSMIMLLVFGFQSPKLLTDQQRQIHFHIYVLKQYDGTYLDLISCCCFQTILSQVNYHPQVY